MKSKFVGTVLRVASVAVVPLAMLAVSTPASAQGAGQRTLFEWRGNVDQEVRVQMQGARTSVIAMGPREMAGYDNARALGSVPAVNGYVSVRMMEGRGNADVVQQPSAQNGYATVVRIRDGQGGAGSYDVAAFWQPVGEYGYGNAGVYGNYGQYDGYGQYGNYGGYETYPAPPVVVRQPVYVGRSTTGKTLPVPSRTEPSHAQPWSAGRAVNGRGYENGNAPRGKALPVANPASRPGKVLPAAQPVVRPEVKPVVRPVVKPAVKPVIKPADGGGKALPGTAHTAPQGSARPRGH